MEQFLLVGWVSVHMIEPAAGTLKVLQVQELVLLLASSG